MWCICMHHYPLHTTFILSPDISSIYSSYCPFLWPITKDICFGNHNILNTWRNICYTCLTKKASTTIHLKLFFSVCWRDQKNSLTQINLIYLPMYFPIQCSYYLHFLPSASSLPLPSTLSLLVLISLVFCPFKLSISIISTISYPSSPSVPLSYISSSLPFQFISLLPSIPSMIFLKLRKKTIFQPITAYF